MKFEQRLKEYEDKYVRLYADYENYKNRVSKEKEDIKIKTKVETLSSLLDINDQIGIAVNMIGDDKTRSDIKMITEKLGDYLKSQGLEEIQTDFYDVDVHDVVSVLETGVEGIVGVVSKGYTLDGSVIRYPKIILSR